jgi:SPP1 family predicted phage head-tail adaptor
MTYRAGELDQRIIFQRRVNTPDGMGGSSFTWVDIPELASVWAHARPKSGREVTEFQRVNAEATYLFVVRNRPDIKEEYRIAWDGEIFNIRYIPKPKKRALYLEIEGERGAEQEQLTSIYSGSMIYRDAYYNNQDITFQGVATSVELQYRNEFVSESDIEITASEFKSPFWDDAQIWDDSLIWDDAGIYLVDLQTSAKIEFLGVERDIIQIRRIQQAGQPVVLKIFLKG